MRQMSTTYQGLIENRLGVLGAEEPTLVDPLSDPVPSACRPVQQETGTRAATLPGCSCSSEMTTKVSRTARGARVCHWCGSEDGVTSDGVWLVDGGGWWYQADRWFHHLVIRQGIVKQFM